MEDQEPIELDGRTGEGGGQLVRIACALAAVATQPIRITHVRGNREGPRGGGLKSQHVTAIEYLAKATAADVTGLSVGSHTLEFRPRLKPSALVEDRTIKISADSPAASTMLIFQAVFPFLLFAGTDKGDPITLELSGGTNVSFSLSYEYLDQVLLPTLQDAFGIAVERKLHSRGWSLGKPQRGKATFKFTPLKPGETLKLKEEGIVYGGGAPGPDVEIEEVDVSLIVPAEMQDSMTETLVAGMEELFPGVEVNFKIIEDSGADSRIYILLVAKAGGLRWGRDILASAPKKMKGKSGSRQMISLCEDISRRVSKKLLDEVSTGGVVDEFLQDQLVIFQALSEGRTSFPRSNGGLEQAMDKLKISEEMHKDRTNGPFGEGSTHTTTARWVTAQLLPNVRWYNKGEVCEGVGMSMGVGKTR
ncbi:RNA 3'-terminal phosphate cyclase domain-containing protein [Madurella fahalii]|uniref:RNA 3'-terminal phosphate cyclase domain-containing protein n=1 Tax=Madurella fahalii TaxID=1157608 RepID=A0ABQ0G1J2_9PEZI